MRILLLFSALMGLCCTQLSSGWNRLAAGAVLDDEANYRLMLSEVNQLRSKGCNCPDGIYYPPAPPLKWDEQLATAAQGHAEDMFRRGYFKHNSPDGVSFEIRIEKTGYKWQYIGENIASGYNSAIDVVKGWRNSRDHCKNLMMPEFDDMGAARYEQFWVQDLGKKADW